MNTTTKATMALALALATTLGGATAAQAKPCTTCDPVDDPGSPYPKPKPKPKLSDDVDRHVVLRLVSVRADDTEDVTGADDLYLAGGLRIGQHAQPTQLAPTSINDGQAVSLDGSLAADGVKGNDRLSIITNATDQDFGRDWQQYEPAVTTVGTAIYASAMLIPATAPYAIAAAPAVGAAYKTFNAISLADKDDILADQRVDDLRVGDFPLGTTTRSFRVAQSVVPYWSDWDYTFTYQVEVTQ